MPTKKEKVRYEVEDMKVKNFAAATLMATNLSIERGDPVTIVERGPERTAYISIQA